MKRFTMILLMFLLVGCAASNKPVVVPFNEVEYAPYSKPGTSTVNVLPPIDSKDKYKGTNRCLLVPVTSGSKIWFDYHQDQKGKPYYMLGSQAERYSREPFNPKQFKFIFENVPAGDYFVYCDFPYLLKSGRRLLVLADVFLGRISVKDGEIISVKPQLRQVNH